MKNKYNIKSAIIHAENKRAQKKGLINNLTEEDFNNWSIEWWLNKNDDGILRCPYSGKIIDNKQKQSSIVLEHIIPIEKGGGTILFNVLPSRADVNSSKNAVDPIEWWIKNFNNERFLNFVEYIFAAYDKLIEKGILTNEIIINIQDLETEEDFFQKNEEINENFKDDFYIKEIIQEEQPKKIKYHSFLATCVSILETQDKDLGKKYRKKILEYEKKGIFKNITNFQNIQSILFEKIKEINSSVKYQIVKDINMSLLINSLNNIDDKEKEIRTRLIFIEDLLKEECSYYTLSDLLIHCPNILTFNNHELREKIKIIKNFDKKINPILLFKNNKSLILLSNKEILEKLEYIRNNLCKNNYEFFIICGNIKYLEIIKYIESCEKSTLLKNSPKNNSYEGLEFWWKKRYKKFFNGNFINTLKSLIISKSYKYTTDEKLLTVKNIKIIDILFKKIVNNIDLLKNNNELKKIIFNEININSIKDNYPENLIGNSKEEKGNNLIKLLYECVDENLIQDYIYLELIRTKKINELEKKELSESTVKVKEYILKTKDVNELTIKKLNEITKDLPGIWKLNTGGFHSRLKQRIIYTRAEDNKLEYVGKKDVGIIIEKLLKEYDFTKELNKKELKYIIEKIIVESIKNHEKNIFSVYNYLTEEEKTKKVRDLFFKEIDNDALPSFLMLEQLIRNKKEEYEKKQRIKNNLLKEKESLEKEIELKKIINYINSLKNLKELRFEAINKINTEKDISLNEWINININTDILKLNNLNVENGSFSKALIEKIRSSSTKYTTKKNINRTLITIIINEINSKLDFLNKPSNEKIKNLIDNFLINIKSNANYIIELEGYKGENIEEKLISFKNLMYRTVEKNNIQLYLMLEQLVQKRKQEIQLEKQKDIDKKKSGVMKRSA